MPLKPHCTLLIILIATSTVSHGADTYSISEENTDYTSCRKSADGEITTTSRSNQIYKWVDEHGKTHFTQSPPPDKYQSSKSNKKYYDKNYFHLSFGADSKIPRYKPELEIKTKSVFKVFTSLIPRSELNRVKLKLFIYDEASDFRSFLLRHGFKGESYSRGIHMGGKNIVGILETTEASALETAIHESTHVITRGNFGRLPKWLNEGLSEYVENIQGHSQVIEVKPHRHWQNYKSLSSINFNILANLSNSEWKGPNNASYYAHSWAFVHFLLSDTTRKRILQSYLRQHLKLPCNTVLDSYDFFTERYDGGGDKLELDFSDWLDRKSYESHYY